MPGQDLPPALWHRFVDHTAVKYAQDTAQCMLSSAVDDSLCLNSLAAPESRQTTGELHDEPYRRKQSKHQSPHPLRNRELASRTVGGVERSCE